jgi:hypothetical protein
MTAEGDGKLNQREQAAKVRTFDTVGELLHWSYANLASLDAAYGRGLTKRDRICWGVRLKLYAGLRSGSMKVGTLFKDVLAAPTDRCVYCGTMPPPKLTGDHLIPKARGGLETGDNLVWACRACNSSKQGRDLLEWYAARTEFPSVTLMRRYLKLALVEADQRGVLDVAIADNPSVTFSLDYVPIKYPEPGQPFALTRR